jgi:transposase InsO family protein
LQLKRKIRKKKVSIIKKILIFLANRTNLLIRTAINVPFQAISSDISEIFYDHGRKKAYLSIHKDVFGQLVYGWQLSQTMETKLVISSFKKAKKSIRKLINQIPKKLLCHSDQGSQYTSYEYVDAVLKSNMRLSYSTPGTPTENPGQESFFGRFKDENQDEIDEIRDFKELQKFISKRINYYNRKRIHTSTGYQTPLKFIQIYINSLSLAESKKWFSISRG